MNQIETYYYQFEIYLVFQVNIDEKIKFQSAPTNAPEKLAKYQIPKLLYNFSAIAMLANAPIEHIK